MWLLLVGFFFVGTLWNVITVSFRQSVIPDHLLGRVNSVYRFFGWGMMPIGAALGGLIVVIVDQFASRDLALRMTWLIAGVLSLLLFAAAGPRLTTAKFAEARAAAAGDDRRRRGANWERTRAGTARNAHWLQCAWTSPTPSTSSATSATAC